LIEIYDYLKKSGTFRQQLIVSRKTFISDEAFLADSASL